MIHKLLNALTAACLIALPGAEAAAAKPPASLRCYRAEDPVQCFVAAAKAKLAQVENGNDRADALGEMLYTLSALDSRDDELAKAADELAVSRAVRPVKQMDLLYVLDLYASATEAAADRTYASALRRFATLEQELKGGALVELYMNACSIIAWDDPFRERWLDFAQSVCTPEKLRATKVAPSCSAIATRSIALSVFVTPFFDLEPRSAVAENWPLVRP